MLHNRVRTQINGAPFVLVKGCPVLVVVALLLLVDCFNGNLAALEEQKW